MPPSASKRDLEASARAAEWAGFEVSFIEPDFSRCGDAEGALAHLAKGPARPALWLGYIPTVERYEAIYQAAAALGLWLPNTPEQHRRAMELHRAYPHLSGLTPATAWAESVQGCLEAGQELGYPIFVKGSVQSLKAEGWKACVAATPQELEALAGRLLKSDSRSRGRVVLRQLLELRHAQTSGLGFPIGREYRVFCYQAKAMTTAYYWDCSDDFGQPTEAENAAIHQLAEQAARRLGVPFCSVDVGQAQDLTWWVVETADGQFTGLSRDAVAGHWHRLATALQGLEDSPRRA